MTIPEHHEVLWQRDARSIVTVQSWEDDDLAVAFEAVSGDTHLMSFAAVRLFELMSDMPISEAEICQQLLPVCTEQDPIQVAEFVVVTLLQLRAIKFVADIRV